MDTIILASFLLFILAVASICMVLMFIQKKNKSKIKKQLEKLEIEKNKIDSSPIIPELTKVESIVRNEKLEAMYNNWKDRLDVIRTNQIPKITDMLLEADYSLSKQDYKSTIYKIAKLEMEIYKVRTNSDFLLNEIKEITNSEERNRAIITNLKSKYRELYEKFTESKESFGEFDKAVDLQFENIASRFEEFESAMENSEFTEVPRIVKSIDDMLKHMNVVIEELPSIYLMITSIIPAKVEEVKKEYDRLKEEGYPLDYLNIEYNIEEAAKKIEDIYDRSRVLNLEDSLFELKVLADYFDSIFTDFDKEKDDKEVYEKTNKKFVRKLNKNTKIINQIFEQMDEIIKIYNIQNTEMKSLESVKEELEKLAIDYKELIDHTENNTFAYSKLIKEIEGLSVRLASSEETIDNILNSIGDMQDDEARARQQLDEIKVILKKSKNKIREYNLPVIPKTYFVELKEAQLAIKEIIKELNKKPITIEVLNTRVDTARDLVLKLFKTTKDMVKTAMFAEMAIVYGNRYRSDEENLDKYLMYAEKLFYNGEYQKSLEITINSLNKVEKGIYDKLLNLYSNELD